MEGAPLTYSEEQFERAAASDQPYMKVYVDVPAGQATLCYFGTKGQQLCYPPDTFKGNWTSNLSVVMEIKQQKKGPKSFYSFSNIVVPNTYLQVTGQKDAASFSPPETTEPLKLQQQQLFTEHTDPTLETRFAFSTTVNGSSYFLKPMDNTIIAERSDSAEGFYYFKAGPSNYPYKGGEEAVQYQYCCLL